MNDIRNIIKTTKREEVLDVIGEYFTMGENSLSFEHNGNDEEKLSIYPKEIQNLFYLSSLVSLAGGDGLIGYVMEQPGYILQGSHRALDSINFSELKALYEQAIAVSVLPDEDGEVWCDYIEYEKDLSWYKKFKTNLSVDSAEEELDTDNTFDLINDKLVTVAMPYIEQYINQLKIQ